MGLAVLFFVPGFLLLLGMRPATSSIQPDVSIASIAHRYNLIHKWIRLQVHKTQHSTLRLFHYPCLLPVNAPLIINVYLR